MADNTVLNVGAGGDTVASDDIGGVKHQRVKLVHGNDGFNDGDASSSNPLPVDVGAAIRAILQAIANPIWEDIVTGRLKVSLDPTAVVGASIGTITNITNLPTLANVTTVATVTNLVAISGTNASTLVFDIMATAWADAVRGRVS